MFLIKPEPTPALFTWTEKFRTEQLRLVTHYLFENFRNELAWFQTTSVILIGDYSFFLGVKTHPNPPWLGLTVCVACCNFVLSPNPRVHSSEVIETGLSLGWGAEVPVWLWADTTLPKAGDWRTEARQVFKAAAEVSCDSRDNSSRPQICSSNSCAAAWEAKVSSYPKKYSQCKLYSLTWTVFGSG